jgi:hypothetical protein
MKTLILTIIGVFFSFSICSAQDEILREMVDRSDLVAHVKVLKVQGGQTEEIGVEEWVALAEVVTSFKGQISPNEELRIRFNVFAFGKEREKPIMTPEKEYLVCLKGIEGEARFSEDRKMYPAHSLVDRWVGALPYSHQLEEAARGLR